MMLTKLRSYCQQISSEFAFIPQTRKAELEKVSAYINRRIASGVPAELVYICTHNSRRSQFGQVWAVAAAAYYGIAQLHSFSGGTEVTAFNSRAVDALSRAGFRTDRLNFETNAVYEIFYDDQKAPLTCFSKLFDHDANPKKNFAAIMTCTEAEKNCPFIPAADLRVSIAYDDPKTFDNGPHEDEKYDERCLQIARESLYMLSLVKVNQWR
jgi:hypothetical protein